MQLGKNGFHSSFNGHHLLHVLVKIKIKDFAFLSPNTLRVSLASCYLEVIYLLPLSFLLSSLNCELTEKYITHYSLNL